MLIVVFALLPNTASGQFTLNFPKIPTVKKAQLPSTTSTSKPIEPDTSTAKTSPVSSAGNTCSDPIVKSYLKDIGETLAEAKEFRPGTRDYYVSTRSDRKNVFLEAALLPIVRKEWFENFKESPEMLRCMPLALDELAAVARQTLPTYVGPSGYNFGTPAEKQALLSTINDLAQAKVLKVGVLQQSWQIAKDNFNFPTARYKHGVIWAQYPKTTHGFCWIFWVNVKQDYAGGGTYGDTYGYFVSRALAGCPAAK